MPAWVDLFLVRHGSTRYTEAEGGRIQGQLDIPLSRQGVAEAEQVAAQLAGDLAPASPVFSSDLDRAHHTARIIAELLDSRPVETMTELRERGMGSSEGSLWSELPADAGLDWEPATDFTRRVLLGLRGVAERGGQEAVVVTHAGVIGAVREVIGLAPAKTEPGQVLGIQANAVGGIRVVVAGPSSPQTGGLPTQET